MKFQKKTTQIILNNNLGKSENLKYLIESLLDYGYSIEQKDEEYGTVNTDIRPLKGLNVSYFLTARAKDNQIILTGKFIINLSVRIGQVETKPSFSDITNKGMKGSANNKSFATMYEYASRLDFSNIEFGL